MSVDLSFAPGLPAVLIALAALLGGAAWFADAYRALRVRRAHHGLCARALDALGEGLVRVRGRVALAGPLFSPLGGRPCAGFVLEAHGVDVPVRGRVREFRAFELREGAHAARVEAAHGEWALPVTWERTFAPGEALGANVEALLDAHPELAWLRRRGGALRLVERALHHRDAVQVIAHAEYAEAAFHAAGYQQELRTGTDGAVVTHAFGAGAPAVPACDWRLSDPDDLPMQVLAEGAPASAACVPAAARTWGVALGPLLSLAGLLVLARLAGAVMVVR
ncbi:MAG: hypothetical protein HZA61_10650 [Candidatus Eisenbacteria bacterium]|uniref:Uncharacterized protein n=1 Tax=Eiseniibacteriota bacterium TaxID=2212470 RepID=A0A933SDV5_UNCEI|nr:hypothetical protein [Candidatus Eisenbacteria bacterium]